MSDDFVKETEDDIILCGSEYPMTHQERYEFVKNRITVRSEPIQTYQERRAYLKNSEVGKYWGVPQDESEAPTTGTKNYMTYEERKAFLQNSDLGEALGIPQIKPEGD